MTRKVFHQFLKLQYLVVGLYLFLSSVAATAESKSPQPDVSTDGARVFADRCVLCHGNYGTGDGFMPLIIKDYPETNLLKENKIGHFTDLQQHINWGGVKENQKYRSPPWIDELSAEEVLAVTEFVVKLQEDPDLQWQPLEKYLSTKPVTMETGRLVYLTRCESCHGSTGRGDGPMSVIVKSPPPFDLSKSQLSEAELLRIISLGGPLIGRSAQMPGWKQELSEAEIKSVTAYIQLFRE